MQIIRFISGVPPSLAIGAGRFIAQIKKEFPVSFYGNKSAAGAALRNRNILEFAIAATTHYFQKLSLLTLLLTGHFRRTRETLIIYHPQELGWNAALQIIEESKKKVWIYLLDESFFCIRSYNHIPGETNSCFRCLGGSFDNAKNNHCSPFPVNTPNPIQNLLRLQNLSSREKVGFLIQNRAQEIILKKHFGETALIRLMGLWTIDFENEVENDLDNIRKDPEYDVVFHGSSHPAKGFNWTLDVARNSPTLRFLFPMNIPTESGNIPNNCHFVPMSWETGLRKFVMETPITIVPSLWSSVIEGALIKSLWLSPRVAVVNVDGSFVQELPEDIRLMLPNDSASAANTIREALSANWIPNQNSLEAWKKNFVKFNKVVVQRLKTELGS